MCPIVIGDFAEVKQYPYRQARVVNGLFKLNRYNDDVREFEEALAKAAGASIDNHTVYELTNKPFVKDAQKIYISCSDDYMKIGSEVIIKPW